MQAVLDAVSGWNLAGMLDGDGMHGMALTDLTVGIILFGVDLDMDMAWGLDMGMALGEDMDMASGAAMVSLGMVDTGTEDMDMGMAVMKGVLAIA